MDFLVLDDQQKEIYKAQLLQLCKDSDREFVPPLSQRSSTTQGDLTGGASGQDGVTAYFSEVMKQKILACVEEGRVLGFVSFKEDYKPEHLQEAALPNIYLSTLILSPQARGKGLTKRIYTLLFDELYARRSIYTRTWSTNAAHIKILGHFGFAEAVRIKDHRGPGLDTVYFVKRREAVETKG